jgi:periplasmic copper chaperone A
MKVLLYMLLLLAPMANGGSDLVVEDAWIRAMPPGSPNSAAYMSLRNTSERAVRVISVTGAVADQVEVHRSVNEQGVWKMQRLEALPVAAGATVELSPGGAHLMLFGLSRTLREGETVPLELLLEDGASVSFEATVQRQAAAASGHHH